MEQFTATADGSGNISITFTPIVSLPKISGIEVLGVHRRLIEGFSLGFGFKAVTVALLGALEPLAIVPASLFVGLLEAGSLSMQRQVGVPSALVVVIEGLTMLFVLAATVRRA